MNKRRAHMRDLLVPLRLPADLLTELTKAEGELVLTLNGSVEGGADLD